MDFPQRKPLSLLWRHRKIPQKLLQKSCCVGLQCETYAVWHAMLLLASRKMLRFWKKKARKCCDLLNPRPEIQGYSAIFSAFFLRFFCDFCGKALRFCMLRFENSAIFFCDCDLLERDKSMRASAHDAKSLAMRVKRCEPPRFTRAALCFWVFLLSCSGDLGVPSNEQIIGVWAGSQWALRDMWMPRGKNWVQFWSTNCPRPTRFFKSLPISSSPKRGHEFLSQTNPRGEGNPKDPAVLKIWVNLLCVVSYYRSKSTPVW